MRLETNRPKVSVFMPVFNGGPHLIEAIESVLRQTYNNLELIICDDGSTDETPSIANRFQCKDERVQVYRNESNLGKIKSLERIMELGTGEYYVFHDADDISHPDRLHTQVSFLETNSEYGIVGCGYIMINENYKILAKVIPEEKDDAIREKLKITSQFHFPATMIRTSFFRNLDVIFRPYFGDNNEDVDLCYRILTISKGYTIPEYLYVYRILENSISRKNVLRNSAYKYRIVVELTLQRFVEKVDSLMEGKGLAEIEEKYKRLHDLNAITVYANSVSYYLPYFMFKKCLHVLSLSWKNTSKMAAFKLTAITFIKILGRLPVLYRLKSFEHNFFEEKKYV